MKFKELKNKPIPELQKLLAEGREKSRELKFKAASDQLKNVRELRKLKRTIAKIMFLLKQKKQPDQKIQEKVKEIK